MPVDPTQLSQDKDFLSAGPEDQIKYLSAQDPDFAKASREDQLGYLGHVTGRQSLAAPAARQSLPKVDVNNGWQASYNPESSVKNFLANVGTQGAGAIRGAYDIGKDVVSRFPESLFGKDTTYDRVVDKPQTEQADQASQALKQNHYSEAAGHGAAAVLPAMGPWAAQLGEQAGSGDISGAAGGLTGGLAAGKAGEVGLKNIIDLANRPPASAPANLVGDTYSKTGDHISSSLRSNTKVDVPAEAKIAAPAIEEGLNDRGITTNSFKGRNGPAALQTGIDNALDIHEARAKYAIDPIRGEAVDPQVLAKNPELAQRFMDKDGNVRQGLTYGDLDAERIKMNKELRMGNFYSKPPSAQYAIQDPMATIHDAANQARDLVYGKVADTTGLDIRPLKQTESALIKLGDLAETTKNTLSPKEAQFNTTPLLSKVAGSVKGALSVKANPTNAFSIPEKTGLFNPLNEFNSHMQNAFPNLKAAVADRTIALPKYNLNLTPPPGNTPAPIQQMLKLSGGENIPGENLKLTSPGDMPPAAQRPFSFMDNPNTVQSGPVAPGGTGVGPTPPPAPNPFDVSGLRSKLAPQWDPSKAFDVSELRAKLKNASIPPETNVPQSLGAAAAASSLEEMPPRIRELLGLERRGTPRTAPMSATELEAAIKGRKPISTPFDQTEGAMQTIANDPMMPKHPSLAQGGHAGNGVASVEELSRPGKNYVVDSHGKLTYHGKSFAPEDTPKGAAHVTVLRNGEFRVNAGTLTPAMEASLKEGLKQ